MTNIENSDPARRLIDIIKAPMIDVSKIILDSFNLGAAEQVLCEEALHTAGSLVEAAQLLGVTRHALKRRIIKHNIRWPRSSSPAAKVPEAVPS